MLVSKVENELLFTLRTYVRFSKREEMEKRGVRLAMCEKLSLLHTALYSPVNMLCKYEDMNSALNVTFKNFNDNPTTIRNHQGMERVKF